MGNKGNDLGKESIGKLDEFLSVTLLFSNSFTIFLKYKFIILIKIGIQY